MAAEDITMMDDDPSYLCSSISTECSSTSSSSSFIECSLSPSSSSLTECSSPSADLSKPTVNNTVSNKRRLMLDIEGYNFQFKDFSTDQTKKFWRCANRACRVIVHTTLENEFIRYGGKSSTHCHLPNPSASQVRDLREAMRKRAENETTSLQLIAEQEVRQALLTGEALAVLPRINALGHNLVNQRRKTTPPVPQSSSFFIPESFTKDYCDKDRLLLYDSDDPKFQLQQPGYIRSEGRMLIWSSDIQLNILFNSQKLHMDGTFSTTPPNFKQVFIIQAFLHNTLIRSVVRRMMALALVPEKFVSTLFDDLQNDLDEDERDELAPLFNYFSSFWLQRPSMWNVFDIPNRTNNFSE
ncbi:unnamed protein product, partial [Adineta steineri]